MLQSDLHGKRIVLGVCGGIAAYKSVELVRRLRQQGAHVRVVMTEQATRFVGGLSFQAVSEHTVYTSMWQDDGDGMPHIRLSRWADMVLIAPATANVMAKLAHGFGDDLLSTLCVAYAGPVVLAPAMNRIMWQHPSTQFNRELLQQRGVDIWGPGEGLQACGERGEGRMLEAADIAERVCAAWCAQRLNGLKVTITAGPTREAIDPVRYLSNHSSGKMGFALAAAAQAMGAKVIVISGPVSLNTPAGVRRVDVRTARQMYQAVMHELPGTALFIGAAAVSDYRPARLAQQKMKKSPAEMSLALEATQDILDAVGHSQKVPYVVGFAAETEHLARNAQAKRRAKQCDMIAANHVGGEQGGFGSDENAVTLFWDGGETALPLSPKKQLAYSMLKIIGEKYHEKNSSKNS